jgi:pyridoxamine 5'-phosphate oxidase-like protein
VQQKNLADLYGLDPIPWSRALEALEAPEPEARCFLATTRPDGRPHVAGIGPLWDQGKVYFVSGAETRKSRNLAQHPHCTIAMALTGIDLAIEGVAERVTDEATLQRLAKRYADQGWPATADGGALTAPYSAPSAGPAPWNLYAVKPVTVFGLLTAGTGGATRWRFDG